MSPSQLTPNQITRMRRVAYRIESAAKELRKGSWKDTGDVSNTIETVQQHLKQAHQLLMNAARQEKKASTRARAASLTKAEFLTVPLNRNPAISSWLYNRLLRLWREVNQDHRRDFTAQDLLDNGLTLNEFRRQNGVGEQTLTDLENIFNEYDAKIPPG